ncbi:hypothetical protein ACO0LO_26455 [Undibacterium sp. TJN25]|uniref:hypothetical protein n=1 Tax=Undibacterium sp. TJN25 TaxID=3413056 RepID=UPI003BEFD077
MKALPTAFGRLNTAAALAVSGCVLLILTLATRQTLERSMLLHMMVQLPLLFAGGVLLAQAATRSGIFLLKPLRIFDQNGVTGLFALLFISAYWMIPKALEECLTSPAAEFLKFASLIVLGAVLPGSLRRANWIIQVFFLGNFCSMTAIVGMLYQDMPQRLCNAYLLDDQSTTGMGLVAASLLVAAGWCIARIPALAPDATQTSSAQP